jgi:hypothetical protein
LCWDYPLDAPDVPITCLGIFSFSSLSSNLKAFFGFGMNERLRSGASRNDACFLEFRVVLFYYPGLMYSFSASMDAPVFIVSLSRRWLRFYRLKL